MLIVLIIPIVRYTYLIVKASLLRNKCCQATEICNFFYRYENFRLKWLGGAFFFFTLALVSRALQTNQNYYIVRFIQAHSLWHIFVMTSAFFMLKSVYHNNQDFIITSHYENFSNDGLSLARYTVSTDLDNKETSESLIS